MGTSIADARNPSRQLTVNSDGSLNIKLSTSESPISSSAPLPVSDTAYTLRQDFEGGNSPIYIGEALPGTLDAASGWRIRKITYTNNMITSITWADGNASFNKVWDDRKDGTYTYS